MAPIAHTATTRSIQTLDKAVAAIPPRCRGQKHAGDAGERKCPLYRQFGMGQGAALAADFDAEQSQANQDCAHSRDSTLDGFRLIAIRLAAIRVLLSPSPVTR